MKRFMLSLVLTTLLSSTAFALDATVLDARCRDFLSHTPYPGFSIAVVQGGKTVYAQGFGVETPGGRAMTADSIGAPGSFNKSMTALAVLRLAAQGKLTLDEKPTRWLPWFRTANADKSDKITLRMLLQNSSGLPSVDDWFSDNGLDEDGIERLLRKLSSKRIEREPGTSFEYSNEGWNVLGLIIRKITGKSYGESMRALVFEPLGMDRTSADVARIRDLDARFGTVRGNFNGVDAPIPVRELLLPVGAAPAGSLTRSTVNDLARYLAVLLSDGKTPDGKVILSPDAIRELWKPGVRFPAPREARGNGNPEEWHYALGWMVANIDGRELVFHQGDTTFLSCLAMIDRAKGSAVVMLFPTSAMVDRYRYQSMYGFANDLLHLAAGEKPTASFSVTEKDPNLRAPFVILDAKTLTKYEGTWLGPNSARVDTRTVDGVLRLHLRNGFMEGEYQVDFLNPGSVVMRNSGGTMPGSITLNPSGEPASMMMMGLLFSKRSSGARDGYTPVSFRGTPWTSVLPSAWKEVSSGAWSDGVSTLAVTPGDAPEAAGYIPDGEPVVESTGDVEWTETSQAGPEGMRRYVVIGRLRNGEKISVVLTAPEAEFTRNVGRVVAPLLIAWSAK